MSGLVSIQRVPAPFQLPTMGDWQNLCEEWGNTLLGKKEITVDLATQETSAPPALVALKHNITGLVAQEAILVKHRARQVLTALRTPDDHWQLVSWRVNADGTVLHTGNSHVQATAIRQLRLVRARNYVVASLTQTGELQLSRWDVSNTGAIYWAGASTLDIPPLQWIDLIALDFDHIVTLMQTATGVWQLALWRLQGEDAFTLLQTTEIAAVAIGCELCLLPQPDGTVHLLTVCAESAATVALKVWCYQIGTALAWVASHPLQLPPAATLIAAQANPEQLLTVVQTATGQLRAMSWQLDVAGREAVCQADQLLHDQVTDCSCRKHGDNFVLGYRIGAGELQLEVWQPQRNGTVALVTTSQPPATSGAVSYCDEPLEGNAPFLTATMSTQGAVTLSTWR